MKYLIEEDVNVNAKDRDGNTPLHLAAMDGRFNIAKILLEHNTNVDARNHQIMTALDCATNNNHQELVEFFSLWCSSLLLLKVFNAA